MKKLAAMIAIAVAALALQAAPAHADAVPEYDHVEGYTSYADGMYGDIYWESNRRAYGHIYVWNEIGDRQCVGLWYQTRVAGRWSAWTWDSSVCSTSGAWLWVDVRRSANIEYLRFAVMEAETNRTAYDTNRPGYD